MNLAIFKKFSFFQPFAIRTTSIIVSKQIIMAPKPYSYTGNFFLNNIPHNVIEGCRLRNKRYQQVLNNTMATDTMVFLFIAAIDSKFHRLLPIGYFYTLFKALSQQPPAVEGYEETKDG